MLFNYRVIKLVQKLAKLFSTQAQRNSKIADLGSTPRTGQNVPSIHLKRNHLMTTLGLRSYKSEGLSVFNNSAKKESLLSKQTLLVKELASRNYKIDGFGAFKKNDHKESLLLKQKQLLNELASRNYKFGVLSVFKGRSRQESLLSKQNPVARDLASRNYKIIILAPLRSNEKDDLILTRQNQLVIELPSRSIKVSILGAAGGVGQPLALLLKLNPMVSQLALYDIAKVTPGVAVDLSHINTCTRVKAFVGPQQICGCLRESKVVILLGGIAMVKNMSSRDELFKTNAAVTYDHIDAIARHCPSASIAIISNPVNSLVPLANEVMKKYNICASNRIYGVTTIDTMRASTFVSQFTCEDPNKQYVPVIGGHGSGSIIPLLSQSIPSVFLDDYTRIGLTRRIQEAAFEVVAAKLHSSTLSMAFAAARFTNSILKALMGEQNVVECAYVKTDMKECPYFAAPIVLGPEGMTLFLGTGKLDDFEKSIVENAIPILKKDIKIGEEFAIKQKSPIIC